MNRRQKTIHARNQRIKTVAFVLLAIVTLLFLPMLLAVFGLAPKTSLAAVGLFGLCRILPDKAGDDGNGNDLEMLDKIEKGITHLKTEVDGLKKNSAETILADQSRWPKELKTAMEDLTKLKSTANDQQANLTQFQRTLETVQTLARREARSAFGSPAVRVSRDPQLRARFNALIRMVVSNQDADFRPHAIRILEQGDLPELAKAMKERSIILPTNESLKSKALGEDSSPGSTLINQDLMTEIYNTLETYGIWNTFAVRTLGTKTTILPVKTGRVVAVAIISEGTQIPDDANKAGTTVTATVIDIAALLNVYLRLIDDAETDVVADIFDDFAEAYAYRLDWFCTQADGTADVTDGGFTGIFGGGGTASVAAAGNTTVESLDEADWRKVLLTVDPAVLQRAARWWLHQQVLIRALATKDGNGRSIFLTALEAPSAGAVGSIFGYPVTMGAVCPTANVASSKVAAFGDPNGQVVGLRKSFTFEASDHHKWDYLQRSFRGYGRAATKIRKAGSFGVLTTAAA